MLEKRFNQAAVALAMLAISGSYAYSVAIFAGLA